jgi:hypothetical protein
VNSEAGEPLSPMRKEVVLPLWGAFAMVVALSCLAADAWSLRWLRGLVVGARVGEPPVGDTAVDLGVGDGELAFPVGEGFGGGAGAAAAYRESHCVTVRGSISDAIRQLWWSIALDAAAVAVTVGYVLMFYGCVERAGQALRLWA